MGISVSAVMPVYNGERYLREAIESILNQTCRDFEFIIINDASTDKSEEIIRSFNDPRIAYIRNDKNLGQAESLNKGIRSAKGLYVARMDQDDISLPERFSVQLAYMETNKEVAILGTWYQEIDEKNNAIRRPLFLVSPCIKIRLFFARLAGWASIAHPTVMIRRYLFDKVGYYDPKYRICQDYDLWLRAVRNYKIENIPNVLLNYRVHDLSTCQKRCRDTVKEMEGVISSNIDFYMQKKSKEEKDMVLRILTLRKQVNYNNGKRVFNLFDYLYQKIFERELCDSSKSKYYLKLREELKLLYLPQLFRTNFFFSLKIFLISLFRYPYVIFSKRFIWAISRIQRGTMWKGRRTKILFIPSGGKLAPATRYRIYQILPFLKKEGIDYKIYSILSERMTARTISSSTFNRLQKIAYYIHVTAEKFIRAWVAIILAARFDLVFLQRTTFPFGMERLLRAVNSNIIFDIDDSVYTPDKEEHGLIGWFKRYTKKKEVISILRVSRCAIAENNHIKNFIQDYCKKVYLITGPIDSVKNFAKENKSDSEEITIGWIGSPSTTPYLRTIDKALRELAKRHKIKLRLIGASAYSVEGVKVESIRWREDTEVPELHKFDIGVMSMPDNEWTRGKVGCKMLQYMANAIPAVVSFTPTTAEIIEDGVNGFLANSEEEWINKLSLLIENPGLMEKIGRAGRETVEQRFAVKANIPRYLEIFRNCVK